MHYPSIFEAPPSPHRRGDTDHIKGSRAAELGLQGIADDLFHTGNTVIGHGKGKVKATSREVGAMDEFG